MLPFIKTRIPDENEGGVKRLEKEGVALDKGVVLTEDFLNNSQELFEKYGNLFTAYPDIFLDLITPEEEEFKLFFYQRIFLRAVMRFRLVYVTACLVKGTPVLTEYGMVPIEQVDVNHRIWTKDGWQYPENLNMRDWRGSFYQISAQNCLQENIKVTDNHRFYTVQREKTTTRPGTFWKEGLDFFGISNYDKRKKFYRTALREVNPKWVEAKDLKPNDWLLSPIDTEVKDIKYLYAPKIPNNHCINIIKDKILLNEDFFEWLGIWLAEGSWRESGEITFTIHKNEVRLAERIKDLTTSVFGLKVGGYVREEHNTQILQINSIHLSKFLEELFDCKPKDINQWNKWVPTKLLHCAPYKQLQLVKGWLDGDGYYRHKDGREYKGTTVSSVLAEGIKMILYRNYINPSVSVEYKQNRSTVYNIKFGGAAAQEFEEAINESRPVHITNDMRLGDYFPKLVGNKLFMTNRIREVKQISCEDNEVWCLQMPNESFNVAGVEGHNCRAWSKSFLTILGLFLSCIFIPNRKVFICAPNKSQGAQIAKEKIQEIYRHWPLLRKEVKGCELSDTPGNFGKDYVTIKFKNGSVFDVVGALESTLGGRRHSGLIDEIKIHDEEAINTIVIP